MGQLIGPLFGNGQDGEITIASSITGNATRMTCSGNAGSLTLTVGDNTNFQVGDLILIHKSRGITTTDCGIFETNRVAGKTGGTTINLGKPLDNSYQDSGSDQSQCVLIPEYRYYKLNTSINVNPPAWDGDTGGIIAIAVSGKMQIDGNIDASLYGFRGGQVSNGCRSGEGALGDRNTQTSPYGNAAGGGVASNNGGGGGGNGTSGTTGAYAGGSTAGLADLTKAVFGGGGATSGASEQNPGANGGTGGGLILLFAKEIVVNGTVQSTGGNGGNSNQGDYSRGGGGAAGGSIKILTQKATLGTNKVIAYGGAGGIATGGNNGNINGYAGGDGRIRVEACSFSGSMTQPAASVITGGLNFCGQLASMM